MFCFVALNGSPGLDTPPECACSSRSLGWSVAPSAVQTLHATLMATVSHKVAHRRNLRLGSRVCVRGSTSPTSCRRSGGFNLCRLQFQIIAEAISQVGGSLLRLHNELVNDWVQVEASLKSPHTHRLVGRGSSLSDRQLLVQ